MTGPESAGSCQPRIANAAMQPDRRQWRSLAARPLRFLLSGGIATLVHWGVMALLVLSGFGALLATAIGASTGAITNYGLQYKVTFQSTRAHRIALPRYLITALVALVGNQLVFAGLHYGLAVPVTPAQAVTTATIAFLNYRLCERLVFHDQSC
ncbi:GtrA family protein [Marinobacter lacisalsi]|uniref:GtrA family protein n=1 Tax=Marinobacter lacisalsi TaxID=475979 RepID=A0ABV8QH46_9GAMM